MQHMDWSSDGFMVAASNQDLDACSVPLFIVSIRGPWGVPFPFFAIEKKRVQNKPPRTISKKESSQSARKDKT